MLGIEYWVLGIQAIGYLLSVIKHLSIGYWASTLHNQSSEIQAIGYLLAIIKHLKS